MAFNQNGLARIGSSQTGKNGVPTVWQYISDDTIPTMGTDGYFNEIRELVEVGDRMFVNGAAGAIGIFNFKTVPETGDIVTENGESAPPPDSVGTAQLQDGAVTKPKLAANSVGETNLEDNAVTTNKIADNAVTTNKIADGAVTKPKLAANSVGGTNIENNAIINSKIADGAVTKTKLTTVLQPSHVVKFAGTHTTTGGGTVENIAVPGVLATDLAFVIVCVQGAGGAVVTQVATALDTLSVRYSVDPQNDTTVCYQVLRTVP